MDESIRRLNPYVGPRAFETGEKLYGRDREVRDLLNFLLSQRIVLLFSPSGAGKTSLIRAGLIPSLQERGLKVRHVIRLNAEMDHSAAGDPSSDGAPQPKQNRYVLSAIASLEEEQADEARLSPGELAALSLLDYLERRVTDGNGSEGPPPRELLIFDQYEEILTLDPTDLSAKAEFFSQLGDCLDERRRFALFAIREDYVAALDPYLRYIPTHLDHRYRLDLLGAEAASSAIQRPAKEMGVSFVPAATRKLVDDLRRVQVQRPDGSLQELPGPYVEPVQLQVVCFRLWQNLAAGQDTIGQADLIKAGDVNQSLASYYRETVRRVSGSSGEERLIRQWFDRQLITEQGFRGQVLVGPEGSGSVSKAAIDALDHAYLIRGEKRRGATWYELAHDRLVEPVRRDNADWFQQNLSLLQRQAEIWVKEKRSDHLLLREQALNEAQQWAVEHGEEMSEEEQAFLQESLEADRREREAREAEQRYERSLRRRLIVATLAAVAALVFAISAIFLGAQAQQQAWRNAELAAQNAVIAANAQTAEARAVDSAGTATAALSTSYAQGTEAANQASLAKTAQAIAQTEEQAARAAEEDALQAKKLIEEQTRELRYSVSAQLAAQGGQYLQNSPELAALFAVDAIQIDDNRFTRGLVLRTLEMTQRLAVRNFVSPVPASTKIYSLAASPDGKRFAWGLETGEIILWNIENRRAEPPLERNHTLPVNVLAFSSNPTGLLISGDTSGFFYLRNLETGEVQDFRFNPPIQASFHPVNPWITISSGLVARAYTVEALFNWVQRDPFPRDLFRFAHTARIASLAWSPDGTRLAVGEEDGSLWVWDQDNTSTPWMKEDSAHSGLVRSLAWSPQSNLLASADWALGNTQVIVWNVEEKAEVNRFRGLGSFDATSLSFSPDGRVLAAGGDEGEVMLWDTTDWQLIYRHPVSESWSARDIDIEAIAFSPAAGINLLGAARYGGEVVFLVTQPQNSLVQTIAENLGGPLIALTKYQPDGSFLGAVQREDAVDMIRITSDGVSNVINTAPISASSAAFNQADPTLALGNADQPQILIYRMTNQESLLGEDFRLDFGGPPIASLAITHTLSAVYYCTQISGENCADRDRSLALIDLSSNQQSLLDIPMEGETVHALAFSPDGRRLAAGGTHGIYVFDTASHVLQASVALPFGESVSSLSFSPDGSWLAIALQDGRLTFWDANSNQLAGLPLSGSLGRMTSLAYDSNGQILFAGLENGMIQAWELIPELWAARLCNFAAPALTEADWALFSPYQTSKVVCGRAIP